ncbi:hypothetical protein [Actinomadura sp. 6N118]|uniref:hypothetical protein n=1 Tax=Actinomadura sp. 6N118 TaxID=3375151 RepID=UPI00378CC766
MNDPWGVATPAANDGEAVEPLPPRLAELAALNGKRFIEPGERWPFAKPEELPEVQALAGEEWQPLDDAPLYCCLPAVWPVSHRCWVADRLPKFSRAYCGEQSWLEPWDDKTHQDVGAFTAGLAAECGLPAPPPGRIWLLRSPWPSIESQVVLRLLARRCDERALDMTAQGITEAARDVLTWSDARASEWWAAKGGGEPHPS